MRASSFFAILTLTAATALSSPAQAAKPSHIGSNGDWEAYQYREDGKKVCYMISAPTKDEGNYTRRGDIYVFVTHRPGMKQFDEVTFDIGYTFKKDSNLKIATDKENTFSLATDGSKAWSETVSMDRDLVKAMKRGRTMTAKGVSSRDTKTLDTYSLKGFTATYRLIDKACR